MRVEDACRPGLFTVDVDDSLEVAAHRMDQAQLGALAVVDGQRLVGIVTERALVPAIAPAAWGDGGAGGPVAGQPAGWRS
jgi:CBS domain-containing protein